MLKIYSRDSSAEFVPPPPGKCVCMAVAVAVAADVAVAVVWCAGGCGFGVVCRSLCLWDWLCGRLGV